MTEAIEGLEDLRRLGEVYRAGDKAIRKAIRDALSKVGKPVAEHVRDEGADDLPQRGGFAARIQAARIGVSLTASTRTTSVALRLRTREGYDLGSVERGRLRHLVYGHKPWIDQAVRAHVFGDAFGDQADEARDAVVRTVQDALATIAREASS